LVITFVNFDDFQMLGSPGVDDLERMSCTAYAKKRSLHEDKLDAHNTNQMRTLPLLLFFPQIKEHTLPISFPGTDNIQPTVV
jgi:hypothetical protein